MQEKRKLRKRKGSYGRGTKLIDAFLPVIIVPLVAVPVPPGQSDLYSAKNTNKLCQTLSTPN